MIKVNSDACIGCGACVAIAPDAFEFNENGVSKVIDGVQNSEAASEAAMSCPVGAIVIEESAVEATPEIANVAAAPAEEEATEEAPKAA